MKLSVLVLSLFSLVAVSFALPVVPVSEELQLRDTESVEPIPLADSLWDKRDITALTFLFRTLNTTGTGVALAETAISLSLTQQQIIKFIGSLIETKGLTTLLEVADNSGLAIDLVVLVLTHYEIIPGLTNIIKAYKGDSSGNSSSGSTLLSSLFGASSSENDTESGLTPLSADYSALGDILGSATGAGTIATGTALVGTQTPTTASTTTVSADGENGGLANILQGLGLALASEADLETIVTGTAQAAGAATTPSVTTSLAATSATQAPSTTSSGARSSGGLISSILDSIFKRDDLTDSERVELLGSLVKRGEFDFGSIVEELNARDDSSSEDSAIAKRDLLDTVYSEIILLIGSDGNIELITESLVKSGLANSLVYEALTNENFVDFDVNLVKYLVDENIITLSSLLSATSQSGLITSLVGDIIGNSTYEQLVINFAIAVITGKIDIIGLIAALL